MDDVLDNSTQFIIIKIFSYIQKKLIIIGTFPVDYEQLHSQMVTRCNLNKMKKLNSYIKNDTDGKCKVDLYIYQNVTKTINTT